ncbi:uncharacterized protein A1O9_09602 [Exophiala aquamarina CBS 119918]|uniref:Conserved oligomeric Golgi complex subunit 4 n=1 Tax=Exophiala aquamarina CBS 119918 TaxID=1182545 RepID=A0A072PFW0_9EURO|nr:uncharacterized protein A1O9_09602 [Exophiala aquamarina CBS 119918]KEF54435.1 hypothetical protein A1O9_09602 [Exophiala aquamarina CBS 119918]
MTSNGHIFSEAESDSISIYNAKSVSEIRAALAELHQKEATVTTQLDALISAQKELQRELGHLDLFRANATSQASKLRAVSNGMLSDAAANAKRISNSVKRLDLEQERVKATLTVVEQVGELKACVLGVSGSMGAAQDWETAASYLSRASKIPREVVDGPFAARVVPTAEVPDAPAVTLEAASESLCSLFLREFDKAVKDSDGARITRFFKLFPLISRSDVGLDVYGRYVCQGVASRARANLNAGTGGNQSKDGFFYANALTKLFEHIAQIIDGHGSLVEHHYGPGRMARVIERLQVEADMQGGIILDTWADERRIDRQLTDIRSYAFMFLVQSFMPAQRGATSIPRSNSPAPGRASEDESVDMKQVDALLNEMASMLGKWSLYTRFVANKCQNPSGSENHSPDIPQFLINSSLMKKIQDRVLTPFNTMTTFFFRRSVEKAFQLDEQPPDLSLNPHKPLNSNPPHVTSAIEDIMYIVNKILQQSLATSQKAVVSSVIPTLGRVLGSDFIGMEQRKMRDESYPKAAIPGQLPPESMIVSFLVLINNLDVAKDYIDQIVRARTQPTAGSPHQLLDDLFPVPADAESVHLTLTSLSSSFSEKSSELISDGVNVVFHNVMKPRLRPILMDAFRDTDYNLSKEQLADLAHELEAGGGAPMGGDDDSFFSDEVRMRFQLGWDALTKPIGRIMTERTFDTLLTVVITYLSKMIEKRLWTYHGRVNEIGASRLEHDVNEIIKVVVKGQKYSFREAFLRCSQICMIMNMDDDEWEETLESGGEVADKLKPDERVRARNMVKESTS